MLTMWMTLTWLGCDKGEDSGAFLAGFTVDGSVEDFWTAESVVDQAELCVSMEDPTPVLTGGELIQLQEVTVGTDASFSFEPILTSTEVGLLMLVDDCGSEDLFMGLATGIPSDIVNELDYGDHLGDQLAYALTVERAATLDAELAAAGYQGGSVLETGALMGWLLDSQDESVAQPAECASLDTSSGGDTPCYYADADESDGLFSTGGAPNTASSAAAGSFYICPAAPVATYGATDCEGNDYFSVLGGSLPGLAMFLRLPRL